MSRYRASLAARGERAHRASRQPDLRIRRSPLHSRTAQRPGVCACLRDRGAIPGGCSLGPTVRGLLRARKQGIRGRTGRRGTGRTELQSGQAEVEPQSGLVRLLMERRIVESACVVVVAPP